MMFASPEIHTLRVLVGNNDCKLDFYLFRKKLNKAPLNRFL